MIRAITYTVRVLVDLAVVVLCAPIRWLVTDWPSIEHAPVDDDPGVDVDAAACRACGILIPAGDVCAPCSAIPGLVSYPEIDGVSLTPIDFDEEEPTHPICRCPGAVYERVGVLDPFDAHEPGCAVRLALTRTDR